MPGELVPHAEIPALAARVSPRMLPILQHIQKAGYILNGKSLEGETAEIVHQLADLGLIDPGYERDIGGQPWMWVINGNGSRVLGYLTGIRGGPHYEIASAELAAWLEEQGKDRWWNVDGDPLLTGRMAVPCPAGNLAAELRKIAPPLLVQAREDDQAAKGQPIGKEKLNELVRTFPESLPVGAGRTPLGSGDRLLYLCWKGKLHEWLLVEDSEMTEQMNAGEALRAR